MDRKFAATDGSFDVAKGWADMEYRIARIKLSKEIERSCTDAIMQALDDGGEGCTWRPKWEGFELMNEILNDGIKNPHLLVEEYHSLTLLCGMFGFRFSEHFKLKI